MPLSRLSPSVPTQLSPSSRWYKEEKLSGRVRPMPTGPSVPPFPFETSSTTCRFAGSKCRRATSSRGSSRRSNELHWFIPKCDSTCTTQQRAPRYCILDRCVPYCRTGVNSFANPVGLSFVLCGPASSSSSDRSMGYARWSTALDRTPSVVCCRIPIEATTPRFLSRTLLTQSGLPFDSSFVGAESSIPVYVPDRTMQ